MRSSPCLLLLFVMLLAGCTVLPPAGGGLRTIGASQVTLTLGSPDAVRDHCTTALGEPVRSCAYVTSRTCSIVVPAPAGRGDYRAFELLGREAMHCFFRDRQ